jgi:hypothetical protein
MAQSLRLSNTAQGWLYAKAVSDPKLSAVLSLGDSSCEEKKRS